MGLQTELTNWIEAYKDVAERNALAENPDESAKYLIAKMREVVEGALPRSKSILEEAAYTGGDVPKKWINDRGNYIQGYNDALKEARQAILKAMEEE